MDVSEPAGIDCPHSGGLALAHDAFRPTASTMGSMTSAIPGTA